MITSNIGIITLFIEGLLSFFSPCVLPLIPLYIGYLTSNASSKDENGNVRYTRSKVLITTGFFILGISTVFFIMGLSINILKDFFNQYQLIISLVGGVILIVFGLMYLNVIQIKSLSKTYKMEPKLNNKFNYLSAFLLGFSFSFAWTPCVGPMLASALVLAATESSQLIGNLYILSYSLGFIIPFLILGLFTEVCLNLIKKNQNVIKWTMKIGGILIILIGAWMIYTSSSTLISKVNFNDNNSQNITENETETNEETTVIKAFDFELHDQFGNTHKMSDYKDNVVMIQFFATWCTYCKRELPTLNEWAKNTDAKVLLVANPGMGQEGNEEHIIKYLEDNNIDIPVLMDVNNEMIYFYGVQSYPTTYMIDTNSNIYGYLPGALTTEYMDTLVQMTKDSVKE